MKITTAYAIGVIQGFLIGLVIFYNIGIEEGRQQQIVDSIPSKEQLDIAYKKQVKTILEVCHYVYGEKGE